MSLEIEQTAQASDWNLPFTDAGLSFADIPILEHEN